MEPSSNQNQEGAPKKQNRGGRGQKKYRGNNRGNKNFYSNNYQNNNRYPQQYMYPHVNPLIIILISNSKFYTERKCIYVQDIVI